MTGFFETLVRPDKEELENMDRREVGRAANILQVGEFQLLQLAHHEWHGHDLAEHQLDALFHAYMMENIVPHWARHYARQIIRLDAAGRIASGEARYHRYDNDFGATTPPHGVRKFAVAAGIVMLVLGSSMVGAIMSTSRGTTV